MLAGVHVNQWVGNTLDLVLRMRPRILKVLDLNHDALTKYRAAVPGGLVLYRKYVTSQPLNDPVADADAFANALLADVATYHGLVDVLEGYNETGLWQDAVNYNLFTVQLAKRVHAAGFQYCAYDFSEENPDLSLWPSYIPGILASDYLGLHEYSAPSMLDRAGDRCLRYRKVHDLIKGACPKVRFLITEAGIDGGVLGKGFSGWKVYGDGAHYRDSVKWYTEEGEKDPFLVGYVLFCFGTADAHWDTFDGTGCPEVIDYLTAYNARPGGLPLNANPNGFPDALWLPSPDFGYPTGTVGRNGQSIVAIVDHIAQGSEAGLDSEFAQPGNPSATYAVNRDGSCHQYVDEGNAPWTSGIDFSKGYNAYKSDLSVDWIKACWDHQLSPNLVSIGIEHEGATGVPLTEAQTQTTLRLHRYLLTKYRTIPLDGNHVVGHYRLDGVNRPNCPGSAFPWTRLFADLRGDSMAVYLGAPHGGATNFSVAQGNPIGPYKQVVIYTFATGALWATPDDGWKVHSGLPKEMTDAQVRDYAKDIWTRGQTVFADGQGIPEAWLQGLLALRAP